MNDGNSIGKWSESPVESWNKHVRSYQSGSSCRSRQVSVKHNIHDIFVRMLVSSHPIIASKRPRPACSICGDIGHTSRSKRHKEFGPMAEEDARLESFFQLTYLI